jgi:hypothetical protein
MKNAQRLRKRLRILNYGFIGYLTGLLLLCEWLIFESRHEFGLSVLFATCGTLVGCFCALLASPYGRGESERFSRVGTTISSVITGYLLAKIIDPIVLMMTNEKVLPQLFLLKNTAYLLLLVTGFLGGFILAYQYRAYLSGEDLDQPTADGADPTSKS